MTLRLRLALFIAVAVVLVLAVQAALGYAALEQTTLRFLDRDLEQYVEVLSQKALSAEDQEFLVQAGKDYAVRSRLVRGQKVLYAGGGPFPEGLGQVSEAPHSVGSWQMGSWRVAAQVLPQLGAGTRLEVAVSSKSFAEHLLEYRNRALVTALVLALLAALFALWLSRRALEPLLEFSHTARKVAESGDLTQTMNAQGGAELRELAQTLNHMLSQLEGFRQRETEFTRHAAHELRTPLSALQLHLDAESVGLYTSGEVLEETRIQVQRMKGLTEALLLLARENQATLEKLDLARLCARLASRASVPYLGPSSLLLEGNAVLLERGLENLLENAQNYAPGDIELTLEATQTAVKLTVRDRGPGLSTEALEQATEPFYRAPGTRGPGSGLGLAVVGRIAEAHGGVLSLENRTGGGLCVTLEWPAQMNLFPEELSRPKIRSSG